MRDRQTTPFLILILLAVVSLVLLVISYSLPYEFNVSKGFAMRIPQPHELLRSGRHSITPELPALPAQRDTLAANEVLTPHGSVLADGIFPKSVSDTPPGNEIPLQETAVVPKKSAVQIVTDEKELIQRIIPISHTERFRRELQRFFLRVSSAKARGELIRVLHYGDSQIEGDRITSELRNFMHARFGGMGPGLVTVVPPTRQDIVYQTTLRGNWHRYSHLSREVSHSRWGVLFSYARFSEPGKKSATDVDASFELSPRRGNYSSVRRFRQARIFFGYQEAPVYVELIRSGISLEADFYPAEKMMTVIRYHWKDPVNDLRIRMFGKSSPDVYAVALDDVSGVAVDNIPLRGSSGLEFSRSDTTLLRKMMAELNPGLILLQFGVNVVPNITSDYAFYENSLYRQLLVLKKINPGIPVIILGVSDMSLMDKGATKSFPNIKLIRDAQRNAASRAGCGFWDTYEAMGGEDSMTAWAFASPPLAQKDFTHFSPRGSQIIGQMFWNSLLNEYEKIMIE